MEHQNLRERLDALLRGGAAGGQISEPHGGLRRHFLPWLNHPADGGHTSHLGGFLELFGGPDSVVLRGLVLDHVAPHSVSFRVVELAVVDGAGAELAEFLITRSVREEAAALAAPSRAADRDAAQLLQRAHQVARIWLATGHHQQPWGNGAAPRPGATLPLLHLAIAQLLTPDHLATPAGQRIVARLPVWLAGGGLECHRGPDGLHLPSDHYVAMVNDLDSPIPPMLICAGEGVATRLQPILE